MQVAPASSGGAAGSAARGAADVGVVVEDVEAALFTLRRACRRVAADDDADLAALEARVRELAVARTTVGPAANDTACRARPTTSAVEAERNRGGAQAQAQAGGGSGN